MKLSKIVLAMIFTFSIINAQTFSIQEKWSLLGATEEITSSFLVDSTCIEDVIIYQDRKWKSYPKDKSLISIKKAQGFWAYSETTCNIDTKSSVNAGGVLDITNIILTKKSANCADYVREYGSSVKDIQEGKDFTGIFEIYIKDDKCVFKSNSIPNHDFNDNSARFATKVSTQSNEMEITSSPSFANKITNLSLGENAMMLNGVKLDILPAGCYGVGNGKIGCFEMSSPWRYDPMSPNATFGTDKHNAHTQPTGAYHYHGSPEALFDKSGNIESPIIGFAIDGFPIFGSFYSKNGVITKATSSYKLKSGQRESINGINPTGSHDGTFRDDYEFVKDLGSLDECNGMSVNGVYGYYITDTYPWAINCYKGVAPIKKRPKSKPKRR